MAKALKSLGELVSLYFLMMLAESSLNSKTEHLLGFLNFAGDEIFEFTKKANYTQLKEFPNI